MSEITAVAYAGRRKTGDTAVSDNTATRYIQITSSKSKMVNVLINPST
jgi:hypothetical protein